MDGAQSGDDVVFGGADRTFRGVAPVNAARCELERDGFVAQKFLESVRTFIVEHHEART